MFKGNRKIPLKSNEKIPSSQPDDTNDVLSLIVIGSVCAIPAAGNQTDTISFIKVDDACFAKENVTDDWGMEIISGQEYIKGRYVMREYVAKKGEVY